MPRIDQHNASIALVEWNWTGHHPYYFSYFAESLLQLGWNVVALCPNPEEARSILTDRLAQMEMPDWQKRINFTTISKTRYRLSNRPGTWIGRLSRIDWNIRRFLGIERILRINERRLGWPLTGIIYPCIYDVEFKDIAWMDRFLHYPWTGLYVHAKSIRIPRPAHLHPQNHPLPERLFSGTRCRAVGLLDEGIADAVSLRIGKPVIAFPDVTDARLTDESEPLALAKELQGFARGRKIVGIFGHLVKSKGIITLVEAAQRQEMQDICFAFGGELGKSGYTREEMQLIRNAFDTSPNIWSHTERIAQEKEMNRLISLCDMIAACYVDFPHSSNILAKAACLRKPVIVNDGYLMAERVRSHALGEVVPQGDVNALCHAIRKLAQGECPARHHGYERFASLHSFESFGHAVAQMVSCLSGNHTANPMDHEKQA